MWDAGCGGSQPFPLTGCQMVHKVRGESGARTSDAPYVRRHGMNISWHPSAEEIREIDQTPWSGVAARVFQPLTYDAILSITVAGCVLYLLAAAPLEIATLTLSRMSTAQRVTMHVISTITAVSGAGFGVMAVVCTPKQLRRLWAVIGPTAIVGAGLLVTVAVAATSSATDTPLVLYAEQPIFAAWIFRPVLRELVVALNPISYGAILLWQHTPDAVVRWLLVTVSVVGLGIVAGVITGRAQRSVSSEREARRELAELNAGLESRVAEQVAEIGQLAELRRFLPPSVADAVASDDRERLLSPHRRKIAVFFCDLRGFTAFTNSAEPEDVLGVVNEYFAVLGGVLGRHNATIAQYTGDGLMAFFGDPVEAADPAGQAVAAAAQLRIDLAPVVEGWRRNGFDLGHGVGISYGHATIGVVGTDGRYDYTPMGSVVNLAARLCAHAKADQILLDHASHVATIDRLGSMPAGTFDLKGFGADIPAYELV